MICFNLDLRPEITQKPDIDDVLLSYFGGYNICVDNLPGDHFHHKYCKKVIIRECHIIIYGLK